MGYADQFDDADILSTLSWMDLTEPNRIMKLAALFLEKESEISQEHRNWDGPKVSNVRPFVKSYYTPPRGRGKATMEMVVRAIAYQRECARKRRANQPYKPITIERQRSSERRRRNELAKVRYSIRYKDHNSKIHIKDPYCVGIGVVGDVQLMVDQGRGYSSERSYSRIYMRHKPSGKVKVTVLVNAESPDSVVDALMLLAPEDCLRSMFDGELLTFDFFAEAYLWKGKLIPWHNVQRVYRGKAKAHKTWARPKKED